MSEGSKKRGSVFSFIIFVILFFVGVPYVLGYLQVSFRKFSIPLQGGPYLTSADDWKTETQVLLRDTTAFWKGKLKSKGGAYAPPELISNFEGWREVCKSSIQSKAIVYCPEQSRIELNRIYFNGISRRAAGGLNHLAVSYVFAHLIGHHVQSQLGTSVIAKTKQQRIQIELQADCLAGMWLRHATKTYGSTAEYYIGRAVEKAFVIPAHDTPEIARALIEDMSVASKEERVKWVKRGFNAAGVGECNTYDG